MLSLGTTEWTQHLAAAWVILRGSIALTLIHLGTKSSGVNMGCHINVCLYTLVFPLLSISCLHKDRDHLLPGFSDGSLFGPNSISVGKSIAYTGESLLLLSQFEDLRTHPSLVSPYWTNYWMLNHPSTEQDFKRMLQPSPLGEPRTAAYNISIAGALQVFSICLPQRQFSPWPFFTRASR